MASGPGSSSSSLPSNTAELLWEDKRRTLRELVSSYRLPLAVKLKSGDISKYIKEGSKSNGQSNGQSNKPTSTSDAGLDSPPGPCDSKDSCVDRAGEDVVLQVHETRRKKIVLARKMTWEKRQNDYVVSGEQVEIPASIKGRYMRYDNDNNKIYISTHNIIAYHNIVVI